MQNSISNEFTNVRGTNSQQRKKHKNDYIIVINSECKKALGIEKYGVIKCLKKNAVTGYKDEYFCLHSFGRIITDDELETDEIAIDQTLRNALGAKTNITNDLRIMLCPLSLGFQANLSRFFNKRIYFNLRVLHSDLGDMEKDLCRVSENTMELSQTSPGNHLILENAISEVIRDIKYLESVIYYSHSKKNDKEIERVINRCFDESFFLSIDEVTAQYPYHGPRNTNELISYFNEKVCCLGNNTSDGKANELLEIQNLFAIREYCEKRPYSLIQTKLPAFPMSSDSWYLSKLGTNEGAATGDLNSSTNPYSVHGVHIDSCKILDNSIDLEPILLDKYYRDFLNVSVLDCVKIKSRRMDCIKDDIIEYGLVFFLTLFAAVATVTPENLTLILISIPFALLFTFVLVVIKSK